MGLTLKAVEGGSHQAERLIALRLVAALGIAPAEGYALRDELLGEASGRHNPSILVRDVVLHARLLVDAKLNVLVDRGPKLPVVAAGILVVGVVLGVVDVLLGAVAAEALGGELELAGSETKGHEAEDAQQQADGLGGDVLDGADIDGLGVVPQPVAKVDTRDVVLGELLSAKGLGHGEAKEGILDVSVAPCFGENG